MSAPTTAAATRKPEQTLSDLKFWPIMGLTVDVELHQNQRHWTSERHKKTLFQTSGRRRRLNAAVFGSNFFFGESECLLLNSAKGEWSKGGVRNRAFKINLAWHYNALECFILAWSGQIMRDIFTLTYTAVNPRPLSTLKTSAHTYYCNLLTEII